MLDPTYKIPLLPPSFDYNSIKILKALVNAKSSLSELRGTVKSIPNQSILINTLSLQEALASSEIENIVTTHDELFRFSRDMFDNLSAEGKEVAMYTESLKRGYDLLKEGGGIISNKTIVEMFRILKNRDDGFRKIPGTVLKNEQSGKIVFVPPQDYSDIENHMKGLENFINSESDDMDELVKMSIIHHQFESIHPFPDGNGRIGRILNVLYLTKVGTLNVPILYLSRSINRSKDEYYRLLQSVRDDGNWESWVLYMLTAIEQTSRETLVLIEEIRDLMQEFKHRIREEFPKIYSQDLINNLFRHPYTRIEYLQEETGITRPTATRYLNALVGAGYLNLVKAGKHNYFVNERLVELLVRNN